MTITKEIEQGFGGGVNGLYDILQNFNGMAFDADIDVAAEDTNVIVVTIQLKDYLGNDLAESANIKAYCCTTSAGTTKETTTVSTETAIKTDGDLTVVTAKTEYNLVSEADGDIDLDFTDTGTNSFYFCLVMPTGKLVVSDVITFTN